MFSFNILHTTCQTWDAAELAIWVFRKKNTGLSQLWVGLPFGEAEEGSSVFDIQVLKTGSSSSTDKVVILSRLCVIAR